MNSKYDWNIIVPYMDVMINNGSVPRKKNFITFRDFKNNVQSGICCKDMIIKQNVSPNFISFLSKFSQGKIKLEKKELLDCYYNKGMSLNDISNKYHLHRNEIRFLRQLYNINRKGASFIKRKKIEIPLTQRQKEILYGSMMGDAYTKDIKYNSVVCFGHSNKQKKYLFWKYNEFKNIVRDIYPKFKLSQEKRKEYKGSTGCWSIQTIANSDIEDCLNEFYKSGKKDIGNKILDKLSPLSLAVWFMDDGYAMKNKNKNKISNFAFCTDSFSEESCNNIVKWFKRKYDIDAYLRERGINRNKRMTYRIIIRSRSVYSFVSLVEYYIIPSMKYKISA